MSLYSFKIDRLSPIPPKRKRSNCSRFILSKLDLLTNNITTMKTISRSFVVLTTIIVSALIVSCSEDYSSPLKGQTVTDQLFETGTNSKTITIGTKDLSKCTVSSNANWCSASIQVSSVVITVQPNDTYEERQAIITLTDPEDGTILSFKVVQKQNDAILIDKPDYLIPEEGGEISIKVQSNVSYTIEIPSDASWLTKTLPLTRGLVNSNIVLKADKNNTGDERGTIIKLIDQKTGTTTQFSVKQELTPKIELSKEEISLYEDGGEFEIKVQSNIVLTSTISDDWINSNGRSNEEEFSFVEKFKVSTLPPELSTRNATIYFSDKIDKWKISKTINVKQIRSLAFEEEKLEMFVDDTYSLTLNNNTGQSVSLKSSNTSVAKVTNGGRVTAVGKGNATITATTEDGKYSAKIDVFVKVALYISSKDVSIYIGDTYQLDYTNNTDQNLIWESSNSSVATVDGRGVVTGIGTGSATIKVTTADSRRTDNATVKVKKKFVYIGEAVDLGLSVLWSKYNLGAASPEEYGEFYSWGETEGKDDYSIETYPYYNQHVADDIGGSRYDAATVKLGGNWRMPTYDELQELNNKCEWNWTSVNNVYGYKVVGPNGNSIFIPSSGWRYKRVLVSEGQTWGVTFWTSTKYVIDDLSAYSQVYAKGMVLPSYCYYGLPIRAVKSK